MPYYLSQFSRHRAGLPPGLRGESQAGSAWNGADEDITQSLCEAGRRRLVLGLTGGLIGLLCDLGASEAAFAEARPLPAAAPLIGIDHIPLVVNDLDVAVETYRRLGFAIKPGRFHPDGIRNQHVKFQDGGGIELITAPAATDELTRYYRQLLAQGEGPAYVSFHSDSLDVLGDAMQRRHIGFRVNNGILEPINPALKSFFLFAGSNRSPSDRAEHFAHTNTARATIAVWVAGGDQAGMLPFFRSLGAVVRQQEVLAPRPLTTTVAHVANGQIIFLPASCQIIAGRPIVGVVFQTENIEAARNVLQAAGIGQLRGVSMAGYTSLLVRPEDTHGIWMEFRASHR